MPGDQAGGSPPHARGRRCDDGLGSPRPRITPACAGKTDDVREALSRVEGSPPHARGRRDAAVGGRGDDGITPACAGKTITGSCRVTRRGDHPRMRGEDGVTTDSEALALGSPPHARGRRTMCVRPCRGLRDHPRMRGEDVTSRPGPTRSGRITPACAGKTSTVDHARERGGDHPRMRGEDVQNRTHPVPAAGSPPHARGRHVELLSDFP